MQGPKLFSPLYFVSLPAKLIPKDMNWLPGMTENKSFVAHIYKEKGATLSNGVYTALSTYLSKSA